MLSTNLSVNQGRLCFAGQDVCALAERFGTPLYLMDEDRIRENCRLYKKAFAAAFGDRAAPAYASKAASFKQIYRIVNEEGMYIDVVSPGEIHTAVQAGFPMEKALFHSNNKSDADLRYGTDAGVGRFVVDGEDELLALNAIAVERGVKQKILLRLTPGIDPHTYEAVNTGMVDSKFGTAIETGQAAELVKLTLTLPGVALDGFHCHVGSQVFDEDVFQRTADIMLPFLAQMRAALGYTAATLNFGGGYGVPYVEADGAVDIAARIAEVGAYIREACEKLDFPMPFFMMEPGRSIVADAGLTVYTVGAVKRIPGYKNYVSVDGGMTDNPRYALYGSKYTVLSGNRAAEPADFRCDLVGRCCESGDVVQPGILLPAATCRGDIVCVCTTGAYNYSMASNYNRVPRPPVVMLRAGEAYVAVRRETYGDLCALDV